MCHSRNVQVVIACLRQKIKEESDPIEKERLRREILFLINPAAAKKKFEKENRKKKKKKKDKVPKKHRRKFCLA